MIFGSATSGHWWQAIGKCLCYVLPSLGLAGDIVGHFEADLEYKTCFWRLIHNVDDSCHFRSVYAVPILLQYIHEKANNSISVFSK